MRTLGRRKDKTQKLHPQVLKTECESNRSGKEVRSSNEEASAQFQYLWHFIVSPKQS
jgi:hypothetical protein